MARRKSNPDEDLASPTFEEALAGLESIVEAMEHEQLPLDELVAYYEKGSILLERCESLLHSARDRIELITLRNKEGIQADDLSGPDKTAAVSMPSVPPDISEDDNNDIRLF